MPAMPLKPLSPAVIGAADDEFIKDGRDVSRSCFDAILDAMKPGVTFGTLFDHLHETVGRATGNISGAIR